MRYTQVLSIFSILLFATGCGSSSNSNNNDEPDPMVDDTPETLSLNGNAADGYLRGATVCLDTDGDRACDGEATSTTTGENGAFTLSATAEDFAAHPVITEVTVGTVDEDTITDDNPQGTPVAAGKTYTLSASPGSVAANDEDGNGVVDGRVFVSPLTTLVEHRRRQILEENPDSEDSLAQAKEAIATQLGSASEALTVDYVAAQTNSSADDETRASALRLHTTARVVTSLLADAEADIAEAVGSGSLEQAQSVDALALVLSQITQQLETAANQIQELLETLDTEDTEAIANAVETVANANDTIDASELPNLVVAAAIPATAITAAEVIQREGGIWVIGVDRFESGGALQVEVWADNIAFIAANGDSPARSVDDCYTVDPDTRALAEIENEGYTEVRLTGEGWAEVSQLEGDDCSLTYTLTDDGGVQGTADGELLNVSSDVQQLSLTDQSIAGLLTLHDTVSEVYWPLVLKDGATFSSVEATGFVLRGSVQDDARYSLGAQDSLESNRIGYHLGHDTFEPSFGSLGFLVHDEGPALINADGTIDNELAFIDVGIIHGQHPNNLSLFLSGTTATYFSRQYDPMTGTVESRALGTTPFTVETVNGARLLNIPTVEAIADYNLYYSVDNVDSDKPFVFTEYQGAVRYVYFDPEETEEFTVLALNTAGRDDLIAAFNTDNFDIRSALPRNLAALNSLIPEGAAFDNSGEPIYYLSYWWRRDYPEDRIWTVNEAITDPNTGAGVRERRSPFAEVLTLRAESRTLSLSDGLHATQWDTNDVIRGLGTDEEAVVAQWPIPQTPNIIYITNSEGEGDSTVWTYCSKLPSDISEGELECLPVDDRLTDTRFASRSRAAIENIALELTANNQTIAIDQTQFVGETFFAISFDYDEVDRVAVTLNDDEDKTVSVTGSGITASNLTYEFNDYGLKITGTLVEDGETEELSEFLLLRKFHEADEVYSTCWKNAEDEVASVSEAVYACALDYVDERTRSVITFSEEQADALEAAGEFTPSS